MGAQDFNSTSLEVEVGRSGIQNPVRVILTQSIEYFSLDGRIRSRVDFSPFLLYFQKKNILFICFVFEAGFSG